MLYQGKNPILKIMAVEHLHWEEGSVTVPAREYASLAFRVRGEARISCGGQRYAVNTNDILYMPQKLAYSAIYTNTELFAIHFVTDTNDSCPETYALENAGRIYELFLQAHALWEKKEPAYAVMVMSQLYGILGEICQKETSVNLPPHFLRAVSYIHANFKADISIGEICQQSGIGTTAFRQLFHLYYQKTPVQYITELRLEYARNLIAGGMPVEQAAGQSGFNDPKYFARVVKKYFHCTPRAFKSYGK